MLPTFLVALALVNLGNARSITVKNACSYTVWPGLWTDLSVATDVPSQATGWIAPSGSEVTFPVPADWRNGRIWGRRNCDFSTNPGTSSCLSGGCNGGLLCSPSKGAPVGPTTVAEFTLSSTNQDFYDVSLVNGFNIPISITPSNGSCKVLGCPVDLNPQCPGPLKGPVDANGATAGCKSACQADTNPTNSPNCCTGQYLLPASCPASGVQYYSFFKGSCPNTNVFKYDQSSSLWVCPSSLKTNYTVTFCP